MKLLVTAVAALFAWSGAVSAAEIPPPLHPDEAAGISEAELEELPVNTTFAELRPRLGGYTATALSTPAVRFRLRSEDRHEFILFWQEETGRVLVIAKFPVGRPRGFAGVYVWPEALRGKRMDAPTLDSS